MDKVKTYIAWAKKNGFWLGSGLLAISMLACWFIVSSHIDGNAEKYKSEVTRNISTADAILKVSAEEEVKAHPNAETEKGMNEQLARTAEEIIKAWELRYSAQQKILQWPKEIQANPQFIAFFDIHNPPETYPEESEKQIEGYSNLYRTDIPRQMERICADVLRAKWNTDKKYEGEASSPEDDLSRFAVVWDAKNQELWQSKMSTFINFDDHRGTHQGPTALQIYMLQQDLWLLEAMFTVIRQVNGDVTANDLAKIKRIDHVVFGREARTKLGSLTGSGGNQSGGGLREGVPSTPSGTSAAADTFDTKASKKPFHGRYVGADFRPIAADTVLNVLQAVKNNQELPAANLELVVAKRVPVRIALNMDEREIPNFIAACANSPFAFEIHQVRKNRHVAGEGIVLNGGGGSGPAGMAGSPSGLNRSGSMRSAGLGGTPSGGSSASSGSGSAKSVEARTNYDVDVEFYGIVKIYNPVSPEYLRKLINSQGGDLALAQ